MKLFYFTIGYSSFCQRCEFMKPTRADFLENIQGSCVESPHRGLWNTKYYLQNMLSVDMAARHPGFFFLRYGECNVYFTRFGHPTHEMTRVAINGELPEFNLIGFAWVTSLNIVDSLHPIFLYLDRKTTLWQEVGSNTIVTILVGQ